ncbi:MAG: O-acetyl-ADP-ribose deacetylase [Candidatus Eisenbacteria bacterium]|uniref:O-acetyl-ADP-ribose deacetylase n=1 Tax=Eiseniibacteriota bacterium TaxID=2212470 RepID=A0A948RU40_UNCEI|nr:O-acetyl-ADP-ribose deacetylase [Candidatus Eisenbacteria bacterium]MBU2689593.1 O-acetyl-ADP-ribose deacetylase [Candidatus Eisenbacteria bacterium]
MERSVGACRVRLAPGDITEQEIDAIVNAANPGLRGGGGVDGAIHRAGGPLIMEECRRIGGCPTGQAVVTGAGDLKARWVIHTVGPIWKGGGSHEAEMLASAYRESLKRAREIGASGIAFPSLSTGAYGYPVDQASSIAVATILEDLRRYQAPAEVILVPFDNQTQTALEEALASID